MKNYLEMLTTLLECGEHREDRTGVGTLGIFSYTMQFDLTKGFPLLTTKKLHLPSIIHELIWFLKGETNTAYLKKHKVNIWHNWEDENGDLGRIYGAQWRDWQTSKGESIDQISFVIDSLRNDPFSRRHIVSAWNPGEIQAMRLPPCHILIQFYVDINKGLHCQLYQRSADAFLGVPFNIASYALLTSMIASVTKLTAKRLIWVGGDVHLYTNHVDQAKLQLQRQPKPLAKLKLAQCQSIFDYDYDSISIIDYRPDDHIQAPIAI